MRLGYRDPYEGEEVPRTRPPYPPEFRHEAIRLVRASEEEHPIPRVAKELGVTAETLRNWLKKDEIDSGEREGLRRLRRENKVLKLRRKRSYEKLGRPWAKPSSPGRRSGVDEPLWVRRRGEGTFSRFAVVQDGWDLKERLLRLEEQSTLEEKP